MAYVVALSRTADTAKNVAMTAKNELQRVSEWSYLLVTS